MEEGVNERSKGRCLFRVTSDLYGYTVPLSEQRIRQMDRVGRREGGERATVNWALSIPLKRAYHFRIEVIRRSVANQ